MEVKERNLNSANIFIVESYSQQSSFLRSATKAPVCAVGGLTHCSTCLGSLLCVHLDTWIAACAGNVAELPLQVFCLHQALILLCRCYPAYSAASCCQLALLGRNHLPQMPAALARLRMQSLKKTALVRGRRESGLVSQSSSYFLSISLIVSPENWHSDQNF